MQFQASSAGAENRASQSCSRRHGDATIHLSAKQKSDPYQEYPEVLVGTKYIYDLGSLFIVTRLIAADTSNVWNKTLYRPGSTETYSVLSTAVYTTKRCQLSNHEKTSMT